MKNLQLGWSCCLCILCFGFEYLCDWNVYERIHLDLLDGWCVACSVHSLARGFIMNAICQHRYECAIFSVGLFFKLFALSSFYVRDGTENSMYWIDREIDDEREGKKEQQPSERNSNKTFLRKKNPKLSALQRASAENRRTTSFYDDFHQLKWH